MQTRICNYSICKYVYIQLCEYIYAAIYATRNSCNITALKRAASIVKVDPTFLIFGYFVQK